MTAMPELPTCPWCNRAPTLADNGAVFCEYKWCPSNRPAVSADEWKVRHGVDAAVRRAVKIEQDRKFREYANDPDLIIADQKSVDRIRKAERDRCEAAVRALVANINFGFTIGKSEQARQGYRLCKSDAIGAIRADAATEDQQ